jgi:hypothetical protein
MSFRNIDIINISQCSPTLLVPFFVMKFEFNTFGFLNLVMLLVVRNRCSWMSHLDVHFKVVFPNDCLTKWTWPWDVQAGRRLCRFACRVQRETKCIGTVGFVLINMVAALSAFTFFEVDMTVRAQAETTRIVAIPDNPVVQNMHSNVLDQFCQTVK